MSQANIFVLPGAKSAGSAADARKDSAPASGPAEFADFEKIKPGDEFQFSKAITAEDVEAFAKLSGDRNPLHMDDGFAARTHFQRRVVHGMLVANYVSTMIGMRCPVRARSGASRSSVGWRRCLSAIASTSR